MKKKREFVEITHTIDLNDIANELSYVDEDSVVSFIEEVDKEMLDWGFTEKCFKYFLGQMIKGIEADELENISGSKMQMIAAMKGILE